MPHRGQPPRQEAHHAHVTLLWLRCEDERWLDSPQRLPVPPSLTPAEVALAWVAQALDLQRVGSLRLVALRGRSIDHPDHRRWCVEHVMTLTLTQAQALELAPTWASIGAQWIADAPELGPLW